MSEKGSIFSSWFKKKPDSKEQSQPAEKPPVETQLDQSPEPQQERTAADDLPSAAEDCATVTAESLASEAAPKGQVPTEPEVQEPKEQESKTKEPKQSWFQKLKSGLRKTSGNLGSGMASLFLGKKIDEDLFEELETQLLVADVGMDTTTNIIQRLTDHASRKDLKDGDVLFEKLKEELTHILEPVAVPLTIPDNHEGPFVILMVGVNGVGKTTTIGKLAKQFKAEGKSVMLAAGDTFRAAAVEQLQVWGERNDISVVAQHTGADSASVIYDAVEAAKARGVDVLIADTAGRLQNKSNLMEELKKIVRVMKKLDDSMPHEVMLTLDAGTGQNAISQAKLFGEAVNVSGLVMTKLDGTAKGGVMFALANQFGIPIRYVGVGEQLDDLRPFTAQDFVSALFDEEESSASDKT
ncbi:MULTISPECIES: signal recognition particle-docking protein FtsY [Gammaproteobacteria]|uniref:signal recognition particle-docking protein FtsY n=1 Tax=Gammaproteobacteria TaxID=1236 RepID=UPI000DD06EF8|nr:MULTISPECIES: signal recognition particle-docking protein FtsY [Gammaproteobacteria]RTE86513.1 signal recognition particle-docking protein FtsY [Aliidiomarina sp. B3213]TCZ90932.1 signal recognition particle-docking protein FtsY [Lysobacter sp. N42]